MMFREPLSLRALVVLALGFKLTNNHLITIENHPSGPDGSVASDDLYREMHVLRND